MLLPVELVQVDILICFIRWCQDELRVDFTTAISALWVACKWSMFRHCNTTRSPSGPPLSLVINTPSSPHAVNSVAAFAVAMSRPYSAVVMVIVSLMFSLSYQGVTSLLGVKSRRNVRCNLNDARPAHCETTEDRCHANSMTLATQPSGTACRTRSSARTPTA